uniref:Uncharacterized protein n=1 Tax=Panagrolaimus davidi TaxID=227884 RepID=A0A914QZH2_9BILA
MSLFKNFSLAQKYYKNDPDGGTFEQCLTSYCNTFNITDTIAVSGITKPPSTFDFLLSTNTPKEKIYKELQNKLYSYDSWAENKTFRVNFDTFKESKKAWISIDLKLKDASTARRKYEFDFVNGKMKGLTANWVQWTNATIPGGKLYFTIDSTLADIKIYINNQFYQKLDKRVEKVAVTFYGGEMHFSNSTLTNDGEETTLWGYDPDFLPTLSPSKKLASKPINTTKLISTPVNWIEDDTSYLLYPITPLKNFEKINYEFRADHKPNTDLMKVQIQAVPVAPGSADINYHVFIWSRIDSIWGQYGKKIIKNCKKPNLFMTWQLVSFYCDNSKKHSLGGYDIEKNVKFLFRNAKVQTFKC